MIDHQPWFVARHFACLTGARRPYRLPQRVDPHQRRAIWLQYACGAVEELEAINDAGYTAPFTASTIRSTAASACGSATRCCRGCTITIASRMPARSGH